MKVVVAIAALLLTGCTDPSSEVHELRARVADLETYVGTLQDSVLTLQKSQMMLMRAMPQPRTLGPGECCDEPPEVTWDAMTDATGFGPGLTITGEAIDVDVIDNFVGAELATEFANEGQP